MPEASHPRVGVGVLLTDNLGRVLLTLIYFFVVFPFGLASRLFGNDPLQRRGGHKDSYWIARARPRQTRQGFERSF